ncbi:MAG: carboxypeptidase regulatory-like domain-containing protein, partial [Prevotella sp.]|nr:carboxypeptidase regulatory-like domain-containing protein [Prevotella sp.]
VNTANIMDIDGFYGEDGKSVSWMQYSDYGNLTAMSLCGQVTSMHDGLPVEGAFITLRHEDQTFTTRTDAIGNYVLTVPDVSHSYEVTCSSEDYCDVIEDDVIIPIQGLRRDFCLKRGVTIVIPSGGICTYSSSLNLDFTQARGGDIKAYYGKRYSNSTFIIEETHTAAAGEGLILKGTPLKQIDVPEAEEVVANDGNLFVGTAFAPYTVTTDDVYVLANKTGKPKFHPAAQGLVIPKNKAYLILYIGEAGAKGIDIIFDETTLIEMIQQAEDGEKHYGINGIRISDTVKGLHVLKGKKVIVK